eukprot:gene1919-2053_t
MIDSRPVVLVNGVAKRQQSGITLGEYRGSHIDWYLVDEFDPDNEYRLSSFTLRDNTTYILQGHEERDSKLSSSSSIVDALCNYFRYSCHIVRGITIKQFRARLFGLAEIYSGYTFDGTTDGIHKAGEDIALCLYFESRENLNRFQSEVIELISRSAGFKRPLVEEDASVNLHEEILQNEDVKRVTFPETAMPVRVFKYQYQHDFWNPDNSAHCDEYSDIASLQSTFGDYVNIADPEIQVQMIEDPRSDYWFHISPEGAHIKDKAKCRKHERNDTNNFIYMSRFLHCYFDGLNSEPPKFPCMKIKYISHEEPSTCPLIPLGLPKPQRVVIQLLFWNVDVKHYAMTFVRGGGTQIDQCTYQMDIYFKDAKRAARYLKWKESQTDRAWMAANKGESPDQFVYEEGIRRRVEEEEIEKLEDDGE